MPNASAKLVHSLLMAIYRPNELMSFLTSLGTHPKKGLSQNFLIDGNILRKTVSAASVTENEWVIEIGPGPGALTEQLLSRGARVIAVERDALLAEALEKRLSKEGHLEVYCADILTFELAELMQKRLGENERAKVVANLPYHLTSPILGKLLPESRWLSSAYVMVQEEVARRLTARPHTGDYSALTLFISLYANANYCFGVSRRCFMPAPNVDSAVVGLKLHPPPFDLDAKDFLECVHTAFGQRRKWLTSSLSKLWERPAISLALEQCCIAPSTRPEELSLDQFIELYRRLPKNTTE